MMRPMCLLFLHLGAAFFQANAQADQPGKIDRSCHERAATILILGTFHFDNPGLDSENVRVDDVLSEKRQREIDVLLDRIVRFQPTKIAIESPYKSTVWQSRYSQYLEGKYTLGRNEIEQIGLKLARRLGLSTLYPVDYQLFMSGLTNAEIEHPPDAETQDSKKDGETAKPSALSESEKEFVRTPLVEHLLRINRPESIDKGHEQYMTMLMPDLENPAIYERTDRVTNWYKRNLRIFANINRIAEFDGEDRILVIMGAGHLKLLRSFALEAPQFCLVETNSFLGRME